MPDDLGVQKYSVAVVRAIKAGRRRSVIFMVKCIVRVNWDQFLIFGLIREKVLERKKIVVEVGD
jgi:hypothetical protein